MREVKLGTKFQVVKGYNSDNLLLEFGSHTRKPIGTRKPIPKGHTLSYDGTARNGSVWFYTEEGDRGNVQAGNLKNMLEAGVIRHADQGGKVEDEDKQFICYWNPKTYQVGGDDDIPQGHICGVSFFTPEKGYKDEHIREIKSLFVGEPALLDGWHHVVIRTQ